MELLREQVIRLCSFLRFSPSVVSTTFARLTVVSLSTQSPILNEDRENGKRRTVEHLAEIRVGPPLDLKRVWFSALISDATSPIFAGSSLYRDFILSPLTLCLSSLYHLHSFPYLCLSIAAIPVPNIKPR